MNLNRNKPFIGDTDGLVSIPIRDLMNLNPQEIHGFSREQRFQSLLGI